MFRIANLSRASVRISIVAAIALVLSACTVTWVTPYDETFSMGVSEFQEQGAILLRTLEQAEGDNGKFAKNEANYTKLIAKADALLTRAISNSEALDKSGQKIQAVISKLIADATDGDPKQYEGLSLTAQNIYDLRALIFKWRDHHKSNDVVSKAILKRRQGQLAEAVAAILALESVKRADGN